MNNYKVNFSHFEYLPPGFDPRTSERLARAETTMLCRFEVNYLTTVCHDVHDKRSINFLSFQIKTKLWFWTERIWTVWWRKSCNFISEWSLEWLGFGIGQQKVWHGSDVTEGQCWTRSSCWFHSTLSRIWNYNLGIIISPIFTKNILMQRY